MYFKAMWPINSASVIHVNQNFQSRHSYCYRLLRGVFNDLLVLY